MKIIESNSCTGHLRLGLMRTKDMPKEDLDSTFKMFLGINSKKIQGIYQHVIIPQRSFEDTEMPKNTIFFKDKELFLEPLPKDMLVGHVFDRKRAILVILYNGEKVVRFDDFPVENPMDWAPAFSVGPYNQIELCQNLSFNVADALGM